MPLRLVRRIWVIPQIAGHGRTPGLLYPEFKAYLPLIVQPLHFGWSTKWIRHQCPAKTGIGVEGFDHSGYRRRGCIWKEATFCMIIRRSCWYALLENLRLDKPTDLLVYSVLIYTQHTQATASTNQCIRFTWYSALPIAEIPKKDIGSFNTKFQSTSFQTLVFHPRFDTMCFLSLFTADRMYEDL